MNKYTILIILLTASFSSYSETYCDKRESTGEGDLPISEESFTKERAQNSLKYLSKYIEKTKSSERPPDPEDMMEVENELIMIKGYIYKQILSTNSSEHKIYKNQKKYLKSEFCNFIQNEAHVRH